MIRTKKLMKGFIGYPEYLWTMLRFRSGMRNLYSGKSVAIVGSSLELIGSGLGEDIEQHDIVVRINALNARENPEDLGDRTDVVFLGGRRDERTVSYLHQNLAPHRSVVIGTAASKRVLNRIKGIAGLIVYPSNLARDITRRVCLDTNSSCWDWREDKPPRSGFFCAASVIKFGGASRIEIFGMSKDSSKARRTINGAFSNKVEVNT